MEKEQKQTIMDGDFIVLKIQNWQKNGSQKAFELIQYKGYEAVDASQYYVKKATRDKEARMAYRKSKQSETSIQETFILDIMREGMKHGDTRLR